jgi:hypothetical protein
MVRIAEDKVIIEIDCKGRSAIQTLVEYQNGLLSALHGFAAALEEGATASNSEFEHGITIQRLTWLFQEMMLTHEQAGVIDDMLAGSPAAVAKINNGGFETGLAKVPGYNEQKGKGLLLLSGYGL